MAGAGNQMRNASSMDMETYRYGDRFDGGSSGWNSVNSMDMMGNNKWGNTYGLSPQFLENLGISGPLTNRVFIANVRALSFDIILYSKLIIRITLIPA